MFIENYIEKYKLFFSTDIKSGKIEKSHSLGDTSGENLISNGATLTCKEQLGYHVYSQSSLMNPYNTSTPLITLSLSQDRNVHLFGQIYI